jgi:hypothetical protein
LGKVDVLIVVTLLPAILEVKLAVCALAEFNPKTKAKNKISAFINGVFYIDVLIKTIITIKKLYN